MMEVRIVQDESPVELLQDDAKDQAAVDEEAGGAYTEDPAKPSSHVPARLFSTHKLGGENKPGLIQSYIVTTEQTSLDQDDTYAQETGRPENVNSSEANMPHLLQSIAEATHNQPHIITIIQDSDEENNLRGEDGLSKELLKRFVIDAEGIHPSIRPIDEDGALAEIFHRSERGDDNKFISEDLNVGKQQVVIFSSDSPAMSAMPNTPVTSDNQKKMTITLVEETENSFSVIQGASSDGEGHSEEASKHEQQKHICLGMDFEIMAELATPDGQVFMREITTQTYPQKKHRQPRKRKMRSSENQSTLMGDVEMVATYIEPEDDDFPFNSSKKRFKCTNCNLKFTSNETCDVHIRCHKDMTKNYYCYFCDYTDTQWTKMYKHLFEHGVEKPHKCKQCNFSCVNKSDLSAHLAVHSNNKKFSCPKCRRLFKHRRNVVAHQRSCSGLDKSGKPQKVEGQEKFICEVCKKQLSTKKNLDKHMEIHLELKPFVCDKCGHATRLKESLTMHKRLHTGEKPFKCDICSYATPDKSSLRRHRRIHTKERPYKCKYCMYSCIQKHCLDTHVRRKHTGEQFVCGLCHYATHDRYALNQHFKRHQNSDGSLIHPVEIVTQEDKMGSPLMQPRPQTSSTTYIALPSGAVLRSTSSGKKIMIEEAPKNIATVPQEKADVPVLIQISPPSSSHLVPNKEGTSAKADGHDNDTSNTSQRKEEGIENKEDATTVELGELEATLLQQIQQPGDEIFIQETGEIVIRRQGGHLLVIQRQDMEEEEAHEVGEASNQEYLAAVSPSEISDSRPTVNDDAQEKEAEKLIQIQDQGASEEYKADLIKADKTLDQ